MAYVDRDGRHVTVAIDVHHIVSERIDAIEFALRSVGERSAGLKSDATVVGLGERVDGK